MEKPQQSTPQNEAINNNAVTVRGAGNEDQPASSANDTLGFKPYVEAVFSYLKNPLTKAPFTLSVEGDWGAGKSSFMLQLEEALKADKQKTIRFNAWRHDKVESMWAAFALHFIKELLHELAFFPRMWANLKLRRKRFDLGKGWFPLLKVTILFIFYAFLLLKLIEYLHSNSITTTIESEKLNWEIVITALGGAGTILGVLFFLGKVADITGNPFKTDLAKFVITPNYAGNVAFIEEFHRDFDQTINILTNNKSKIFVFIDDLDRADVPKAAELMQGLNMMISNSARLIFIIGMDREKVAAGVAAKYKDLLPFLNPNQGALTTIEGLEQAKAFGYQFLEKFVQLSFQLPKPSSAFTESYIDSLSGITIETNAAPIRYNPILTIADGEDNRQFRQVTVLLAPFFDDNPRRIKQFVNAFRLKAHIANSTGLFNEIEGESFKTRFAITIPQLGKFITLLMLWPTLADTLVEAPLLFDEVCSNVDEKLAVVWKKNKLFVELLNLSPPNIDPDYDMRSLNVIPLLETSPLYKPNQDTRNNEPTTINPSNTSFSPTEAVPTSDAQQPFSNSGDTRTNSFNRGSTNL